MKPNKFVYSLLAAGFLLVINPEVMAQEGDKDKQKEKEDKDKDRYRDNRPSTPRRGGVLDDVSGRPTSDRQEKDKRDKEEDATGMITVTVTMTTVPNAGEVYWVRF
jgi:hypothetical protein